MNTQQAKQAALDSYNSLMASKALSLEDKGPLTMAISGLLREQRAHRVRVSIGTIMENCGGIL